MYLKNLEIRDKRTLSGMIIYPENGKKIDSTYDLHGHKVLIKTVNLDLSPREISNQLIQFLEPFKNLSNIPA